MDLPRPRPLRSNSAGAWAFALGAFLISLAVRAALTQVAETGSPYLAFIPAIILATYFSGLQPAIACGVLSLLAARYFFGVPAYSFSITENNVLGLGLFVAVVAIDIAIVHIMRVALERLDEERLRSAALAEQREVLFRELQHRVANNLAVVSALLNLQRATISDAKAKQALSDAATRLALIAKIQRRLHDPAGGELHFGSFVEELAHDVLAASGASNIVCLVSAADAVIPEDKLIPLALIVTELISNALEHGFVGLQGGSIRVDFRAEGNERVLTVADDGKGLPAGFSVEAAPSTGLRIVRSLANQINGHLTMENDNGATCRVVFQT